MRRKSAVDSLEQLRNVTALKIKRLTKEYERRLMASVNTNLGIGALEKVPILAVMSSLDREYRGDEAQVVNKKPQRKQKVSLNVGGIDLPIGEYDSGLDGDIAAFVARAFKEKKVKPPARRRGRFY